MSDNETNEKIHELDKRVSVIETKVDAFIAEMRRSDEDFKAEMRDRDNQRAKETAERDNQRAKEIAELRKETNEKFNQIDAKFDNLSNQMHQLVLATIGIIVAILIAAIVTRPSEPIVESPSKKPADTARIEQPIETAER